MENGRPRWLAVAAVLAALNLGAAWILSADPARQVDFRQVAGWVSAWTAGVNPYAASGSAADYPPWALVTLSPLSLLPAAWAPTGWACFNLLLLAALVVRFAREMGAGRRAMLGLALLFAATASSRTLVQFSLLSDVLAIAGGLSAGTVTGGVAVGLALMKPQIGGVVLLWLIFKRDWRRAAVALAVPIALTMVFAWRVSENPAAVLRGYARVLNAVHGSADPLPGHTELRAWILWFAPDVAVSLAFAGVLAVALSLPGLVFAWRRRVWSPEERFLVLGLLGSASLLAVRHMSYDFVLLWPALLAWGRSALSGQPPSRSSSILFWGFSTALIVEPPAWSRYLIARWDWTWLSVAAEFDRVVALTGWICLATLVLARSRAKVAARQNLL